MPNQGDRHKFAITNLVDDYAADDDAKTETRKTCTTDRAQLSGIKTKLFASIIKDSPSDSEANARREDRHEACP